METISRPYGRENDLSLLVDFVTSIMSRHGLHSYWHVGDVIWGMYQNIIFDPRQNVRLWENEQGELLACAWIDKHGGIIIQAHPRLKESELYAALLQQMLAWGEKHSRESVERVGEAATLEVTAFADDFPLISLVERQGYTLDESYSLQMVRDLHSPVPEANLQAGWVVRPISGENEFEERVSIHREVWHPSRVTLEAYRRMRTVPGYTPELDLVAISPAGTFASYCICWLDPTNHIGEFEPVGTRAAFRRQGLGKAVMLEGLRRLQAQGMHTAIVYSVGSNEASRKLYESVGFRTNNQFHTYIKHLSI